MTTHRLRAPSTDGALLAVPPLSQAGELLAENAKRLDVWDYDFQGRRASLLRPLIRSEVLEKARLHLAEAGLDLPLPNEPRSEDRLVVTGHQPELFHPGVWIKNFAAAAIAKAHGATCLNLIVDNDIPKSASLRIPKRDQGVLKVDLVDFDDWAGEIPYEDMPVRNEAVFESFGERALNTLDDSIADPILREFWPKAVAAKRFTDRVGLRFATARREVEASLGVHNLEIPLSKVCETEGFLWFTCHILAQLERFQGVHNDALKGYRTLHKIRSRHHPVPALGKEGEWLEAPFWVWRAAEPRRRPLLVLQKGKVMELRIGGETAPFMELPLSEDREGCCAVECLQELPGMGIRLRTRALTTTMFSRFLLGDIFLHGIGGAKYDELGDEVSSRFFGTKPPTYLTLSLTLWLGLGDDPASPSRLEEVDRLIREYRFNPDRHLQGIEVDPAIQSLMAAKQAAILGPVETHAQRVERFQAIRRSNEALAGLMVGPTEAALAKRTQVAFGLRQNALSHSREFSFVLHSREHLVEKMRESLSELDGSIS